jgi:type IV secretory pathway TrbD component
MNRTVTIFLSSALGFAGLILADSMFNWAWYWKVGAAVGLGIIPWFFVRRSTSATPATPAAPAAGTRPTCPTTARRDFWGDTAIPAAITVALWAALAYGVWFWVVIPVVESGKADPQTRVVNNGFAHHDATYPREVSTHPFEATLSANQPTAVFEVKAGDPIKIYRLDAPIRVWVKGQKGWTEFSTPYRFRPKQDGTLMISSPTPGNHVYIHNEG